MPFKKFIKKMKIKSKMLVVLGCSRLGANIASAWSQAGCSVSIVDKLGDVAFKKLDVSYSGYTVSGDATDKSVLEKAYIQDADQVVITTEDDNTNIFLACLIMKEYPQIKDIVVRLRDETKKPLIDDERITLISPTSISMKTYENIQKAKV